MLVDWRVERNVWRGLGVEAWRERRCRVQSGIVMECLWDFLNLLA
jgi:hypothetical protein